jgi:hypothetical protein
MEDRSNPLLQEFQELIEYLFHSVTPAFEPFFECPNATWNSNIETQRGNSRCVPATLDVPLRFSRAIDGKLHLHDQSP